MVDWRPYKPETCWLNVDDVRYWAQMTTKQIHSESLGSNSG